MRRWVGSTLMAGLRPNAWSRISGVLRAVYETGRVLDAGNGLAETPIIDYHAYTDLQPNGDGHVRYHQFSTRTRLIAANGHADNHVMFLEDNRYGLFSTESPVLMEALRQMDRWLTHLAADDSRAPRALKVLRAKPGDLTDACWTSEAVPQKVVEPASYQGPGVCNTMYPAFSQPRMVAGAGIANDVLKCRLKPIDPSDYTVTFTDAEQARLRQIFSEGVCDWTTRGIGQGDLKSTWLSFGPAGFGSKRATMMLTIVPRGAAAGDCYIRLAARQGAALPRRHAASVRK